MATQVKKLHPALKHAGYSALSVLPGENAAEFEKLHRDRDCRITPPMARPRTISLRPWRACSGASKILQRFELRSLLDVVAIKSDMRNFRRICTDLLLTFGPIKEEVDPAVREAATRAAEDQARKELGDTYELAGLAEVGETATVDGLMKDLEIQDRLDAMFDKCIKRLLMVRGLKSIYERVIFSTSETSRRTPESCVTGK